MGAISTPMQSQLTSSGRTWRRTRARQALGTRKSTTIARACVASTSSVKSCEYMARAELSTKQVHQARALLRERSLEKSTQSAYQERLRKSSCSVYERVSWAYVSCSVLSK